MLEEWELPLGYSGSMQADSMTRKKLAQESGRFNLEKFPIFKGKLECPCPNYYTKQDETRSLGGTF